MLISFGVASSVVGLSLGGVRHDVLAGNEELLACVLQLRLNLSACVDDTQAQAEFKSDSYKIVTGNGNWAVTSFRCTFCGGTQSCGRSG